MNIEDVRLYCLGLPFVTESLPFGEDVLVFKVGGKMFALIALPAEEQRIALKCDPEEAIRLRDQYEGVTPAWHMNKQHWNDIYLSRDLSSEKIQTLIRASYDLVWAKLSKRERTSLQSTQA